MYIYRFELENNGAKWHEYAEHETLTYLIESHRELGTKINRVVMVQAQDYADITEDCLGF